MSVAPTLSLSNRQGLPVEDRFHGCCEACWKNEFRSPKYNANLYAIDCLKSFDVLRSKIIGKNAVAIGETPEGPGVRCS
jgi:hypothetical protein